MSSSSVSMEDVEAINRGLCGEWYGWRNNSHFPPLNVTSDYYGVSPLNAALNAMPPFRAVSFPYGQYVPNHILIGDPYYGASKEFFEQFQQKFSDAATAKITNRILGLEIVYYPEFLGGSTSVVVAPSPCPEPVFVPR